MSAEPDRHQLFIEALADFERASARLSKVAGDLRRDLSATDSPDSEPIPHHAEPTATAQPSAQPPVHPMVRYGQPTPPQMQYGQPPGPQQPYPPRPFPPQQPAPPQQRFVPQGVQPPPSPLPPHEPWWKDTNKTTRVFASVGALITIAGVIFLVALAIQRGLLGIVAQVTLAYLLGAILVGSAVLVHRKLNNGAGASALMITGVVTAHITTSYVSGSLEWWPVWVGTLLIIAVGAGGLAAGSMWQLRTLTLLVGASTIIGVLVSYELDETITWTLAAAVLIGFATSISWFPRPDLRVSITATAATLFMALIMLMANPGNTDGGLIVAALIIGSAGVLALTYQHNAGAGQTAIAIILAGFTGPVIAIWNLYPWSGLVGAAFSLWAGSMGLYLHYRSHTGSITVTFARRVAQAGMISAAIPLLILAVNDPNSLWKAPVTAGFAIVAVLMVMWRHEFLVPILPAWFIAGHLAIAEAIPYILSDNITRVELWTTYTMNMAEDLPAALFLILGNGALIVLATQTGPPLDDQFRKVIGLIGLLTISAPIVLLVLTLGGPFALGHILVSIGWMLAAAILLLRPSDEDDSANTGGAVLIAAVAVVKLVFFDLSAVGGVLRVIVFIACGLLLLTMAILRSRRDRGPQETPKPPPVSDHHDWSAPTGAEGPSTKG
ncbi:hypothetical protein [Corynebacterium sputi]|uniref:hypothetical protein n=1 Tax=Corynebacterium sputi TaxID=489915 RepID=UPI00040147C2|nr:hypothetical protein [Corynebacterium sputi]